MRGQKVLNEGNVHSVEFILIIQLVLIKEIDEYWWNMKNEEGKVGLFPKDYLQNTRPQPVAPNEELDSKVCIYVHNDRNSIILR